MANKYTISQNVLKEYDSYVVDQKSKTPIQPFLHYRDWIVEKIIEVKKKSEPKKIVNKLKFLEFVYLSELEYANLIEWYWKDKIKEIIQRLNDYIWSKGDSYKSHYHTILVRFNKSWIEKINTIKDLPITPDKRPEKPYKPLTKEDKEKAKELLQSARNLLISNYSK